MFSTRRLSESWAGRGGRLYLVTTTLTLPVMVLLHELGHYLTGYGLGFSPGRLTYDSAPMGTPPPGASPLIAALPYGMGQAVSLVLSLAGAAVAGAARRPCTGAPTVVFATAFAVVFNEAFRSLAMGAFHVGPSLASGDALVRGFDELSRFAVGLGGSRGVAFGLDALGVLIPAGALAYVLSRLPDRAARCSALGWATAGMLAGFAWYFGLVGPLVLP